MKCEKCESTMDRVVCYVDYEEQATKIVDIEYGVYVCTKCGYYDDFMEMIFD